MNSAQQIEQHLKILAGLKLAYERMLEFKRRRGSVVVVAREGEIVWLKP